MSWNILAHEYTYKNKPPGCEMKHDEKNINIDTDDNKQLPIDIDPNENKDEYTVETIEQYETRLTRMLQILRDSDYTIICLQEVRVAIVERLQIEFVQNGPYQMYTAQGPSSPTELCERFSGPAPGLCISMERCNTEMY
jgi:hypothetical protein